MRRIDVVAAAALVALIAALGVGLALTWAPRTITVAPASSLAASPRAVVSPTAVSPTAASPSVSAAPSQGPRAAVSENDPSVMLRVHNELRSAIGAPAVRADVRVMTAAQRHAEYLARSGALGHDEVPDGASFTGATVRDRLAAQGYNDATASEVATSFESGTDGVRSLWLLPYHRLGLMHPHAVVAGWGHAEMGARSVTVGVMVYDFAASAPDRVRSPGPGQRVAREWAGEEFPNVLPSGAARPVGYPIMVIYSGARAVELRRARITDASGREVAHHVVPQIYERDYVAIVPTSPLIANSRYRVRLELTIAGSDLVDEWEFDTER